MTPAAPLGTVYLLHFSLPFRHAQHYLGWTDGSVTDRLARHLAGRGARLVARVAATGRGISIVRTWHREPRATERRLKGRSSTRLCPVCEGRRAYGRGKVP